MKLYFDYRAFIKWLQQQPITVSDSNSPWELFRYYHNFKAVETGAPEWGFIYKNAKGRITLVGQAEIDFQEWNK